MSALSLLLAPLLVIAGFGLYLGLNFGLGIFRRIPYEALAIAGLGVALGVWRVTREPGVGAGAAALATVALAAYGLWWVFGYSMFGVREDRPAIGDRFPEFALADSRGATFALGSARGRPILLLFYRGDW